MKKCHRPSQLCLRCSSSAERPRTDPAIHTSVRRACAASVLLEPVRPVVTLRGGRLVPAVVRAGHDRRHGRTVTGQPRCRWRWGWRWRWSCNGDDAYQLDARHAQVSGANVRIPGALSRYRSIGRNGANEHVRRLPGCHCCRDSCGVVGIVRSGVELRRTADRRRCASHGDGQQGGCHDYRRCNRRPGWGRSGTIAACARPRRQ